MSLSDLQKVFSSQIQQFFGTFYEFYFLKSKWFKLLFKYFMRLELSLDGRMLAWHA